VPGIVDQLGGTDIWHEPVLLSLTVFQPDCAFRAVETKSTRRINANFMGYLFL
jgi:hypothetical protein